jgi:peptide chain release factor 1
MQMSIIKNKWWLPTVDRKKLLLEKLSQENLDLKEMIDLQKELGEITEVAEIAEKADLLSSDNEFLSVIETTSSKEAEEIHDQIKANECLLLQLENQFKDLLKPTTNKANKIILEVRPGTGGQEASLFAALLVEMYKKYAQHYSWIWDVLSFDYTDIGGVDYISVSIEGKDSFLLMEHESGVHRVQRIPKTESNGRIHTSTATVAVLPEPEDANVDIDENYIRIDVFRAGGAGGQHVNKTESAVRLTYEHPDLEKIVISIQDEKSQHKNKAKAMKILKAKVASQIEEKLNKERSDQRKGQVGTGERSEKIRTYNFPQSRVTDHRSGVSVYNIQDESLLLPKDLHAITEPIRLDEINEAISKNQ